MKNKSLHIRRIMPAEPYDMKILAYSLENQSDPHAISNINWPSFPYCPDVSFRIGYWADMIILKFDVREQSVRAVETRINGEVYKDSCVEFFVSLDGKNYYNFEFNCIGTIHVAHGEGRHNRKLLPEDVINKITVESSLGNSPFETRIGDIFWSLTCMIPSTSFLHDPGFKPKGKTVKANFYKCGDELPVPHFVTWAPIGTSQPDYHRPEYFGEVIIEG